jgi:hypothetical protein
MFRSWKSRAAVFAVTATMAVPVLGLASPAGAAKGGNGDAAHACQKGGWMNVYRSDGTSFANQDACVSYGAHGGRLTTKTASQLLCESYGGTFAHGTTPVVWTCNGWSFTDNLDYFAKYNALTNDCIADGGSYLNASGNTANIGVAECRT